MSKVYMFPEGTSKIDIINNTNAVDLEKYTMDYKINFKLDSCHILTLILDVNLLKEDNMLLEIDGKKTLKVSHQNNYEVFDICEIDKMLDTVEVTARQWSIEKQRAMFIVDTKPRNLGSLAMMDWLKSNTEQFKQGKQFARDLEIDGNITDLISTNIWHDNFYNATCDLVELYGGEIKREKFKVSLVDYVGSKTAKYKIEYAVNLLENNAENQYDIVIGVLPKGYDKLYGDIVYSGLLKEHPNIVGQTIEKEYKIRVREEGKEDEDGWIYYDTENEAKVALQELATKEFTENHIDQPIISFTTKFLDLSTTDDFKDQPKVFLSVGDKVNTVIPHYDIDIETRIIEMVYDGMLGEYTDIILSNNDIKSLTPPTISSISQEVKKLPSIDDVIETSRRESEAFIMNGFGGYTYTTPNFYSANSMPNIEDSEHGLVVNKNGLLGYRGGINPKTGEVGESTVAIDINGNINASVITTGQLNASLIRTGYLSNFDNSFSIDMGGTGGCLFRNNGKEAMKIENNQVKFFNWAVAGDYIGSLGSLYDSTNKVAMLSMYNDLDSVVTIGYNKSNNTVGTYMEFDKYGLRNDATYPIQVWENMRCNRNLKVEGTLRTDYIKPRADNTAMLIDCTNLTVTGSIYASNVGRAATMALEKDSNEEYRLVTKGELMSEIEQLKAQIEELKALVVK